MSSLIPWTQIDVDKGRVAQEIYEAQEQAQASAPVEVAPIEPSLPQLLADHSHQAYIELGGKEYLKRNPTLLNKMLLKQVEIPDQRITLESHSASLLTIREEMPWISARRLLYQVQAQLAPDIEATRRAGIEDATPREPAADPLKSPAEPFSEPGKGVAAPPPENVAAAPADIRKDYGPRGTARGK